MKKSFTHFLKHGPKSGMSLFLLLMAVFGAGIMADRLVSAKQKISSAEPLPILSSPSPAPVPSETPTVAPSPISTFTPTPTPTPAPEPFKVLKVEFTQIPKFPNWIDPDGKTICTEGRVIPFTTTAAVTVNGPGTARIHWFKIDQQNNSTKEWTPIEEVSFARAGTFDVHQDWTYLMHDYHMGVAYWNRLYFNLYVTEPNKTSANEGLSQYGWGTYKDICS